MEREVMGFCGRAAARVPGRLGAEGGTVNDSREPSYRWPGFAGQPCRATRKASDSLHSALGAAGRSLAPSLDVPSRIESSSPERSSA